MQRERERTFGFRENQGRRDWGRRRREEEVIGEERTVNFQMERAFLSIEKNRAQFWPAAG